jgi:chorismate dehydratase
MIHSLGCVSFLNSKPLIDSLVGREDLGIHFAVPAKLLNLIEAGTVSTALMSVVDYHTSRAPLLLLPAGMIGCDGPTLTVRIYSRMPPAQIKTLHADTDSHTSVILARILLKERYGISPELQPFTRREDDHTAPALPEAMLLIGDKVVNASPDETIYRHQLDLGEEWKTLTGLPFVFAMWMIRRDRAAEEGPAIVRLLADAQRQGARTTEQLLDRYAAEKHWPRDLARRYFTEYLRYEVTPAARRGMELFFQKAHAHHFLPILRPIEYLELPRS